MDFRQLEMFLAVAENLSFTLAGEHLHVSQSAISRKIGMLEDELGEKLFKRVNRKVFLTGAGETLLRYTRKIFQDIKHASIEISEVGGLRQGRVRIAAGMTACIYLLPPVLEKLKKRYPQLELEVVTGSTESLLTEIRNSSIDLGIFTLPIQSPDLEVIPLCEDELVVVASPKHPVLSKKASVRGKDLAEYPMILFVKGSYTRKVLDQFFADIGITPRISMELESIATIKPLVEIDLGISILPLRAVMAEVKRKELHCLRIRDLRLARHLGVVFQKSEFLPKLVSELLQCFTANERGELVQARRWTARP